MTVFALMNKTLMRGSVRQIKRSAECVHSILHTQYWGQYYLPLSPPDKCVTCKPVNSEPWPPSEPEASAFTSTGSTSVCLTQSSHSSSFPFVTSLPADRITFDISLSSAHLFSSNAATTEKTRNLTLSFSCPTVALCWQQISVHIHCMLLRAPVLSREQRATSPDSHEALQIDDESLRVTVTDKKLCLRRVFMWYIKETTWFMCVG